MYEIDLKYIGVENVILVVITIIMILLFKYICKSISKVADYKYTFFAKAILLFVISITLIINILTVSQRAYIVNSYKNKHYSEVKGIVENFSYILAHNSNIPIGFQFEVNSVEFFVNKGFLNYGYTIKNDIGIYNGIYVDIYYIDNETILRIEKH